MEASQKDQIRMKIQDWTYSLFNAPRVLYIDRTGVYINKDGSKQDVTQALEDSEGLNLVLTPKLKADFHSYDSLSVGIIGTEYFESRKEFEDIFVKEWKYVTPSVPERPIKIIDKIVFQKAAESYLKFKISSNMDFYLANTNEMESDLNQKVKSLDHTFDQVLIRKLEKELFFNQIINIFGELNDAEEKENFDIIFRDFRLLHTGGNDIIATAKRGDNYVILRYDSMH